MPDMRQSMEMRDYDGLAGLVALAFPLVLAMIGLVVATVPSKAAPAAPKT